MADPKTVTFQVRHLVWIGIFVVALAALLVWYNGRCVMETTDVNCYKSEADKVEAQFKSQGWEVDEPATLRARQLSSDSRTTIFFKRCKK